MMLELWFWIDSIRLLIIFSSMKDGRRLRTGVLRLMMLYLKTYCQTIGNIFQKIVM